MSYTLPTFLKDADAEIYEALYKELQRQETGIELIASENYASPAVMATQGSVLTNKYAEGYPGKRYYGGCQYVDIGENLAKERLRKLFRCDDSSGTPYEANVQPHSGAQANMAVFLAFLQPGDKILGLDLSHGGHLTHGCPVNFSGKIYDAHHYQVNKDTELFDYDEIAKQAEAVRPKLIVAGYSAYPKQLDFERFAAIAKSVDAYLMCDIAHIAGLIAGGQHPSPVGHADFITSTTHKTLRGPRGGIILCKPEYAKKINSAVFPGMQGGPLMHVIAAKAVAFGEALKPEFQDYQKRTVENCAAFASALQAKGARLVGGGTENHLVLVDVSKHGLTGKLVERVLDQVHITVNKNTIPFETKSPFVTSGIRMGTPAVTTRGFGKPELEKIADWFTTICQNLSESSAEEPTLDESLQKQISEEVMAMCKEFPVYRA